MMTLSAHTKSDQVRYVATTSYVPPLDRVPARLEDAFELYLGDLRAATALGCEICFGAEYQTAWRLMHSNAVERPDGVRSIFLRPCFEAVVCSYVEVFRADFSAAAFMNLAAALTLAPIGPRKEGSGKTTPYQGVALRYDPDIDPKARLNELLSEIGHLSETAPLPRMLEIYAALKLAQPLSDSNSRTANAVLALLICRNSHNVGAAFSLAPIFLSHPSRSFAAWRALGERRDWEPLVELLTDGFCDLRETRRRAALRSVPAERKSDHHAGGG